MAYNFTRYVDYMAKNGLDAVIASNYALTSRMLNDAFKDLGLIAVQLREYNRLVGCDKKGDMIAVATGPLAGIELDAKTDPLFESSVSGLIDALKRRGLERGRIGLEMLDFPAQGLLMLQESLPNAEFADATWVVRQDMAVKTELELRLITKAVEITEAGFRNVVANFRECLGRPESELIFRLFAPEVNRLGGEVIGCNLISVPYEWYGEERQEPLVKEGGRPINFDLLVGYHGLMCDIAFRAIAGDPNPGWPEYFAPSVVAKDALVRTVKPGMTAGEAQAACLQAMRDATDGAYKDYWAVHGCGLHVHEFPQVGSPYQGQAEDYVFETGMVVSVESIAEEAYLITDDGLKRIGEMPMKIYQA